MLSDKTVIKLKGAGKCSSNGEHKVQKLFQIAMNSLDLWKQAYINIYPNKGAMTQGVDGQTIDGFSEEMAKELIQILKKKWYSPNPSRRIYIPKANGKKRPLGIPSAGDKLVQEVWRMILEQIYEPVFSDNSHGFRRKRSCHTALEQIQTWKGTKWFIEFDIKGFFDNINHKTLMTILEKKIDDPHFLKVIRLWLKAGYCEEWKFHKTHSGTPQGGIISPLLANIYLNELDDFIAKLCVSNSCGKIRKPDPIYVSIGRKKSWRSKLIEKHTQSGNETERQKALNEWKSLSEQQRSMSSSDQHDPNFRRLWYVRYADDFVLGFIGPMNEAKRIQDDITSFVQCHLQLDIAPEKSGIKHHSEGVKFLGYNVKVMNEKRVVKTVIHGRATKKRSLKGVIRLEVPPEKLHDFCKKHKYGHYTSVKGGQLYTIHRPELLNSSLAEIVLQFNAELRGLANYYALAKDRKTTLNKLYYLWESSLLKTMASKQKVSVSHIARLLKTGSKKVVKVKLDSGKVKEYKLFQLKDLKPHKNIYVDTIETFYTSRTELSQRMDANECEYCGKTKGYFEVHHIRKMSSIAKGKQNWQIHMIARNRKTMVLCVECHDLLHSGKLPDWRYNPKSGMESRVQ
jgi:RNA-directed DNA polymerase